MPTLGNGTSPARFGFRLPPTGRVFRPDTPYVSEPVEEPVVSVGVAAQFSFLMPPTGRVVRSTYTSVEVPDSDVTPPPPPGGDTLLDWGNLGDTDVSADWGDLGATDEVIDWGIIS